MPLSESAALTIYNTARILVLLATLLGVFGTIGLFWGGGMVRKNSHSNFEDQLVEAQKAALKWESEATLAQKELTRLKSSAPVAPAVGVAGAYSIGDPQKQTLVDRLKFLAKAPVRIAFVKGNTITQTFAEQLGQLLTSAGFTVTLVTVDAPAVGATGLNVVISDANNPPDGAMELLGALQGIGLPVAGVANSNPDLHDIYLEIADPPSS